MTILRRLSTHEALRLQLGNAPSDYLEVDGPKTAFGKQMFAIGNSWHRASAEFVSDRVETVARDAGIIDGTRDIRYATVCSGIECQSVSVTGKRWVPKFFSEVADFPCRVLAARYPDVPNLGDMANVDGNAWNGKLDILSGGTSCQDFSICGSRAGAADGTRSSLCFHWLRILKESGTPIAIWENVPGAFTTNGGKDFAAFLKAINDNGYSVAWRLMDGQFACTKSCPRSIPQRRRRIWLVAWQGDDWRFPARCLLERDSRTGMVTPIRRADDGTVIDQPRASLDDGLFGMMGVQNPSFNSESRADLIPLAEFPKADADSVRSLEFLRGCGEIVRAGAVDDCIEDFHAGSGVACGGRAVVMRTTEWTGGYQLPWGEVTAPAEYDGTISALRNQLDPWSESMRGLILSKRCCQGMIDRVAGNRGKRLSSVVDSAIRNQIRLWDSGALDNGLFNVGVGETDSVSLDANFGFPSIHEVAHTLKCTTRPGWTQALIQRVTGGGGVNSFNFEMWDGGKDLCCTLIAKHAGDVMVYGE